MGRRMAAVGCNVVDMWPTLHFTAWNPLSHVGPFRRGAFARDRGLLSSPQGHAMVCCFLWSIQVARISVPFSNGESLDARNLKVKKTRVVATKLRKLRHFNYIRYALSKCPLPRDDGVIFQD